MASINMMGSYSGIDMSVIDSLIEAEKARGVKYTNQKSKIETEQNAWKDVNTRLDSLYKKLETLTEVETFQSRTVKSNVSSNILTVNANKDAAEGQFRVHVEQLAESTRLTGAQVAIDSIHTELNFAGNFTFSALRSEPAEGEEIEQHKVIVEAGDSLKDISGKINELTEISGIQASIVNNHLVLTDTKLGTNEIKIHDDGTNTELINNLGFSESDRKHEDGKMAIFTVNGVSAKRDSNTIDDVVEGLIFTLQNTHKPGETEVITVSSDNKKTTDAVKEFVDQYNSVMNFLSTQQEVGDPSAEDNKTGVLTGDGTVMRLQSGLRSLLTRNLVGGSDGDFKNIEDIGITLDRYGVATLDESALNEALQEDPTNVARFFYSPDVVADVAGDEGEVVTGSQEREGMSELLRNFIDTYISTSTTSPGIISNKNKSFDNMLKDINEQIEVFNNRVDRKRDRLVQQFTALDIAMMQAQSQMDYMYSQLGMDQGN